MMIFTMNTPKSSRPQFSLGLRFVDVTMPHQLTNQPRGKDAGKRKMLNKVRKKQNSLSTCKCL